MLTLSVYIPSLLYMLLHLVPDCFITMVTLCLHTQSVVYVASFWFLIALLPWVLSVYIPSLLHRLLHVLLPWLLYAYIPSLLYICCFIWFSIALLPCPWLLYVYIPSLLHRYTVAPFGCWLFCYHGYFMLHYLVVDGFVTMVTLCLHTQSVVNGAPLDMSVRTSSVSPRLAASNNRLPRSTKDILCRFLGPDLDSWITISLSRGGKTKTSRSKI